jgi:two-component system chemotaxis response regulator CheY
MNKLKNKKIMVVDDVALATFFIASHLEESGFENVHTFEDSTEAWNEFAQALLIDEGYDLIITDLNMPGLDGMDFLKQIKSDPMSAKTPVIIASADYDPIVIKEAEDNGSCGYFTKPIDLETLKMKIKEVL